MSLQYTSAIPVAPAPSSFLDRLRAKFTVVGDRVKRRVGDAAEDFHFILGRETTLARAAATNPVQEVVRKHRLCGMLFSAKGRTRIPIYEGSNTFAVRESGRLTAITPDGYTDYDFEIRVSGEMARFEAAKRSETKNLYTNDEVELGDDKFLVKMLPEIHRKEVYIVMQTGGGSHVR